MNCITNITFLLFISLLFLACNEKDKTSTKPIAIIPQPVEIIQHHGSFKLNKKTRIVCSGELKNKAEQLANIINTASGYNVQFTEKNERENVICLALNNKLNNLGKEGYKLDVQSKIIHIEANSEVGILYGIQTLRQILPSEIESKSLCTSIDHWEIPCVTINDKPRFEWRGLMLDCSRTFWNKEFIKRTIGLLSLYKMNVLHLHLTDDQGWRVEIDHYPELTQKGARFPKKYNEPKEREGYYSKDDIKEIVEYAKRFNVDVVPEIEMPGHTLAVLACYPELSCTEGPFEIHPFFKGKSIHEDIFCAGKEQTFEFLENVLTEVFEMFPSDYIHIGGDEAPKARWKECSKCQQRIKDEGLTDEHELQSWFIKRMEKTITANGKKLIGWNEILEGGLDSTAHIMYWKSRWKDVPQKAFANGNNLVMSPQSHCYFDYTYERISTMKAYELDPVFNYFEEDNKGKVKGVQANFWSHIDRTEASVEKQLFPRILSIAEIGWSPNDKKNSNIFKDKVFTHLNRLKELDVNYYQDSTIINH